MEIRRLPSTPLRETSASPVNKEQSQFQTSEGIAERPDTIEPASSGDFLQTMFEASNAFSVKEAFADNLQVISGESFGAAMRQLQDQIHMNEFVNNLLDGPQGSFRLTTLLEQLWNGAVSDPDLQEMLSTILKALDDGTAKGADAVRSFVESLYTAGNLHLSPDDSRSVLSILAADKSPENYVMNYVDILRVQNQWRMPDGTLAGRPNLSLLLFNQSIHIMMNDPQGRSQLATLLVELRSDGEQNPEMKLLFSKILQTLEYDPGAIEVVHAFLNSLSTAGDLQLSPDDANIILSILNHDLSKKYDSMAAGKRVLDVVDVFRVLDQCKLPDGRSLPTPIAAENWRQYTDKRTLVDMMNSPQGCLQLATLLVQIGTEGEQNPDLMMLFSQILESLIFSGPNATSVVRMLVESLSASGGFPLSIDDAKSILTILAQDDSPENQLMNLIDILRIQNQLQLPDGTLAGGITGIQELLHQGDLNPLLSKMMSDPQGRSQLATLLVQLRSEGEYNPDLELLFSRILQTLDDGTGNASDVVRMLVDSLTAAGDLHLSSDDTRSILSILAQDKSPGNQLMNLVDILRVQNQWRLPDGTSAGGIMGIQELLHQGDLEPLLSKMMSDPQGRSQLAALLVQLRSEGEHNSDLELLFSRILQTLDDGTGNASDVVRMLVQSLSAEGNLDLSPDDTHSVLSILTQDKSQDNALMNLVDILRVQDQWRLPNGALASGGTHVPPIPDIPWFINKMMSNPQGRLELGPLLAQLCIEGEQNPDLELLFSGTLAILNDGTGENSDIIRSIVEALADAGRLGTLSLDSSRYVLSILSKDQSPENQLINRFWMQLIVDTHLSPSGEKLLGLAPI